MTILQFTDALRSHLHGLHEADVQGSLDYYTELIADRMEAGMTEEEAVAALGAPADVAREILLDMPLPTVVKTAVKKTTRKRKHPLRVWEIVLLALGAPIWLSLLIAFVAVFMSVYVVLWSVIVSFWAVDVAFAGVCIGCLISGFVAAVGGQAMSALLYGGTALVAAGFAVASFIGCLKLTVLFAKITACFGRWVKALFVGKERMNVEA